MQDLTPEVPSEASSRTSFSAPSRYPLRTGSRSVTRKSLTNRGPFVNRVRPTTSVIETLLFPSIVGEIFQPLRPRRGF